MLKAAGPNFGQRAALFYLKMLKAAGPNFGQWAAGLFLLLYCEE
jgi:hypothetical protein